MQQVSAETLREIYDEEGGDFARVAHRLGLTADQLQTVSPVLPEPIYRRRAPPDDLGKPELRQFIVSRRHANHPSWPSDDEKKIEEARAKYCAGTHEMCQGRDRNWFVLYCIPRKHRVGARQFFRTWDD